MNRPTASAIILIAFCAVLTGAQAQNVYRCGNTYSQAPCPGGVPVNADDSRSKAQMTQSESAIQRDLRTGAAMEKSRQQQEEAQRRTAQVAPVAIATKSPAPEPKPGKQAEQSSKKKPRNPEYFTARTPHDKKNKKSDAAAPASTTTGNTGATK